MEPGSPSAGQDWTEGLLQRAWTAVGEGDPATAQRLLIAAKHDRADPLEPELAELEAAILAADGSLRPAADLLERAARGAEPGEAARLLAAAVQPSIDAGRREHALELAQAARELARDADPVVQLRVESMYADACAALGNWSEAHHTWRTAAAEGERAGLAHDANGRLWLSEACHTAGLNDRARELALVAVREARQAGATRALTSALQLLFSIELVTGRMRPAAAAAEEELELARGLGRLMDHKEALGHLAWCAAHAAEPDRCRELVAQRYELGERLGDDALLHPSLGVLELGLGNAPAAVSAFKRTLRTFALRGYSTAMSVWIVDGEVVEALLLAGHEAEARAHLARFEQEARAAGRPHALSLAHRCRGLLARDAELDADFEAALTHDDDEPRPLERARTLLSWGMRLRRAKRRADARAKLEDALEELDRLGSRLWAARAEAELAATGKRARRRAPDDGAELTEREQHVAELVAEGLTNREIAERLYLSTNTVETHLRHIFQKRGVRSRTELARSLG